MLYREHRGTLTESLATTVSLPSVETIKRHIIRRENDLFGDGTIIEEDIEFTPYGHDGRCDWDTWIVTARRYAGKDGTVALDFADLS